MPEHDNLSILKSIKSKYSTQDNFLEGGYARISHFQSPVLIKYFEKLEECSDKFFNLVWKGGYEDYNWTVDPLHEWSRVWEYPLVAAHLSKINNGDKNIRVLDIGSAVTFFTFYMLLQGLNVTNLDSDSRMPTCFERAFKAAAPNLGISQVPAYLVGDARDIKLPDESYDIIICISVLEHIRQYEQVIKEFERLLVPGGHLILTFDTCVSGTDGVSMDYVPHFLKLIGDPLLPITSQNTQIPDDILNMQNSPANAMVHKTAPRKRVNPLKKLWPPHTVSEKMVKFVLSRAKSLMRKNNETDTSVFGGVWKKQGK